MIISLVVQKGGFARGVNNSSSSNINNVDNIHTINSINKSGLGTASPCCAVQQLRNQRDGMYAGLIIS